MFLVLKNFISADWNAAPQVDKIKIEIVARDELHVT